MNADIRRRTGPTVLRPSLLAGRADFIARLGECCADARSDGDTLAVLCIDLDRFKHINAAFGHDFGDAVLRAVGIRLRTGVDGALALAHVSGDEFVLVMPVVDANAALTAAQRVHDLLSAPLTLGDGPTVRVSGSIGVALYPEHGEDPASLLNRADTAAYRAKERTEDNCQLYNPAMEHAPRERQRLLVALHGAIEQGQFSLAFQPKLTLDDRRYAGAEVLMRWLSPSLGEVNPDRFVPIAEDAGLIQGIGDWVLAQTARTVEEWRRAGLQVGRLAVNVSAAQLRREDFSERFADLVERLNGHGSPLEIEITESALIANVDSAAQRLGALRALGVAITLDDFGTGYSSFAYLKRLPIDALKIAPDFITDISNDPEAARLVAAMIAMARTLGLRVVAEGVETPAQAQFLAEQGCHIGQGFLFGRPMTAAEFATWLADCPR